MNPNLDTPRYKSGTINRKAPPVSVISYQDNPDGTTTNTLSDGSQDTGKLALNNDGTYSFNIDTTQPVSSEAFAKNYSRSDVYARRNQLAQAQAQRLAAEQQQQALQAQTLKAGQMSEEEAMLSKKISDYNNQEIDIEEKTRVKMEQLNKNAAGLFGGGLEQEQEVINRQKDEQLRELALKRLSASNTLQALTGVRSSRLDALKTSLGFEDKRLERLLGIEKDLKGMDKEEKKQALDGIGKIIEYSEGVEFEELDPQSQQEILQYAANSALPLSAIKQALKRNKIAFIEERQKAMQDQANSVLDSRYKQSQIDENYAQAQKLQSEANAVSTAQYTPKQLTALTKLNQDVSKNATYTKTTNMRAFVDNVASSLSQGTGVGDLAAINQFQKVIDEGAVTRDQDVKLIQESQSLVNSIKTKYSKLGSGQQLSPELRSQMRTAVETMYEKQVEALQKDPYIKSKKKEAELNGLTISDTIIGELGAFGAQKPAPVDEIDEFLNSF